MNRFEWSWAGASGVPPWARRRVMVLMAAQRIIVSEVAGSCTWAVSQARVRSTARARGHWPGTAARYSNRCALRPSCAHIHTRAVLHRLTASRAVPTVCIQMLSLVPRESHCRWHHARGVPLPQILVGFTRMKCAGTPSTHGSSPALMNGARSASVSR